MKCLPIIYCIWVLLTYTVIVDAINSCENILKKVQGRYCNQYSIQLPCDNSNNYKLVVNATTNIWNDKNVENKSQFIITSLHLLVSAQLELSYYICKASNGLGLEISNYNEIRNGKVEYIFYTLTYSECNYFPKIYKVALNGIEYCNELPAHNSKYFSAMSDYYKLENKIITKEEHVETDLDTSIPTNPLEQTCGTITNIVPINIKGKTVNEGEFPWIVGILSFNKVRNDYNVLCTGNLISNQHVITDHSCVPASDDLLVVLGIASMFNWAATGKVVQITSGKYKSNLYILKMAHPVVFNDKIRPICLWNDNNSEIRSVDQLIGWNKNYTKIKNSDVTISKTCNSIVGYNDRFCAALTRNPNKCVGNNGHGFVTKVSGRYYLRGVVINANNCIGNTLVTSISEHNEWIKNVLKE